MDETKLVTQPYNQIASHFNTTRVLHWTWITDYINRLPQFSKILDIGCGSGRNMTYPDMDFVGIDSCKEFIKICTDKNLQVAHGDMCMLPFRTANFDNILSIASFHHLSTVERRIQALGEMYRVLKPGGTILISVWSINQPKKTRRTFDKYGDTIVNWVKHDKVYERYYYIFQIPELLHLFEVANFKILSHIWDCGNEVFILRRD